MIISSHQLNNRLQFWDDRSRPLFRQFPGVYGVKNCSALSIIVSGLHVRHVRLSQLSADGSYGLEASRKVLKDVVVKTKVKL